MSLVSIYRDYARQVVADLREVAAHRNVSTDTAFDIAQDVWDMEKKHEAAILEQRAVINEERAAAAERLPEVLSVYRAQGVWPKASEIMSKIGLPPTRGHVRWAAHQLKRLSYQPVQPNAQPAE